MNGGGFAIAIILTLANIANAPAQSQFPGHCQPTIVCRLGQNNAIARPPPIRTNSCHPIASRTASKEKPLIPAIAVKKSAAREKVGARKNTHAAVVNRKVSVQAADAGMRYC